MKKNLEGKTLTVYLENRIDVNNAPLFEKEIFDAIGDANKIILNANDLEYISSAGLRVILKLRKTISDILITEVSVEVYSIFNMTGFTELFPITRKLRELSVEGCQIIGKGNYGTVYRISKDTIIKVYSNVVSLEKIQQERELSKKAFVLGIPTAIPYDIVKVGENYGAVFELLDAETFQERISRDYSKIDDCIRLSVNVLKTIHKAEVKPGELTDKKAEIREWLNNIVDLLDEKVSTRLIKLYDEIEDSTHLLHGDYHIKNVMMIGDDPYIIDMDTLSYGSPIFELGFMYSSYIAYREIDRRKGVDFFGVDAKYLEHFFNKSIELYCEGMDQKRIEDCKKKAHIIACIKLIDKFNTKQENLDLIDLYIKDLSKLVFEVDTLNI